MTLHLVPNGKPFELMLYFDARVEERNKFRPQTNQH